MNDLDATLTMVRPANRSTAEALWKRTGLRRASANRLISLSPQPVQVALRKVRVEG